MQAFVRTNSETTTVQLTEISIPDVAENEVLIKVQAFGVGIHDRYFIPTNVDFPYTIGSEGAGVISKVGNNNCEFQVGDRVIFSSSLQPNGGCWAEYVVVPTENLIRLPKDMTFEEGAALPVAGKTAVECIRTLNLKEGETLFIAGASGAIGTVVIQLARQMNVHVISSASSKNHAYMQSLGAEKTVDYKNPSWKKEVTDSIVGRVDAALAIQPGTVKDCIDVVKNNGRVITVSGDQATSERGISVQQFPHLLTIQQAIEPLVTAIVDKKIQVVIEKVFPFEQALEALTKTETRHARGKLVVTVRNE